MFIRSFRFSSAAFMSAMVCVAMACSKSDGEKTAFESGATRPDVLPVILNHDLPFRYPPALYAEKMQGNVMLRLFIDKEGAVVPDSTRVVESSSIALLDSAAVTGSRELRFVPAKSHGAPMPVSILFPVLFRHPEAPPPAGDTLLRKVPIPADSSKKPTDTTGTAKPGASTPATSGSSKKSTSKR